MSDSLVEVISGPGPAVVLDGGLATQLESRGHDLSDSLWSARLLLDDPDEIAAAHADFFAAGAQIATAASYQVSSSGFRAAGLTEADTRLALSRSVDLARRAAREAHAADGLPRWVAASVGPYGASLADGSEYHGDYDLSVARLRAWHRPRLHHLAEVGPDVLAVETIPCLAEAEALVAEIAELHVPAWLSFTAVGDRTRRGEPLAEVVDLVSGAPGVVAVGVNCCDPADIPAALNALGIGGATGLPGVAYPNSGETWDATGRRWVGWPSVGTASARAWVDAGARLVGGCCRVTPTGIRALAEGTRAVVRPSTPTRAARRHSYPG